MGGPPRVSPAERQGDQQSQAGGDGCWHMEGSVWSAYLLVRKCPASALAGQPVAFGPYVSAVQPVW
jgi:hypothetical protein